MSESPLSDCGYRRLLLCCTACETSHNAYQPLELYWPLTLKLQKPFSGPTQSSDAHGRKIRAVLWGQTATLTRAFARAEESNPDHQKDAAGAAAPPSASGRVVFFHVHAMRWINVY